MRDVDGTRLIHKHSNRHFEHGRLALTRHRSIRIAKSIRGQRLHNQKHRFKCRDGALLHQVLHYIGTHRGNLRPGIAGIELFALGGHARLDTLQFTQHGIDAHGALATDLLIKNARRPGIAARKRTGEPVGELGGRPPLGIGNLSRRRSSHARYKVGQSVELSTRTRLIEPGIGRNNRLHATGGKTLGKLAGRLRRTARHDRDNSLWTWK